MDESHLSFSRRGLLASLGGAVLASSIAPGALAATFRVRVEDYRRPGLLDRLVIQGALDEIARRGGNAVLEFEPGRVYRVGSVAPPNPVFLLRNLEGVTIRGNGASLVCQTRSLGKTQMFLVQRCKDLSFSDLFGTDVGTNLSQEWQGMDFIHLETTAGLISNIALANIEVDRAVSLLTCSGVGSEPRAIGIRLSGLVARNCYYGLSFQENGDDVRGDLRASNCRRVYFPYGVRDHDISLDISHDFVALGGDACILIKRYLRDTRNIRVNARFSGTLDWNNLVKLEQQPGAGDVGVIENVSVTLQVAPDASDPWNAAPLAIEAYRKGRKVDKSPDIWRGITLNGCFGPVAGAVVYRTIPNRRPDIGVESSCGGGAR